MVDDSRNASATIYIRKKMDQLPCFQRVVKLSNQHRILWEEEDLFVLPSPRMKNSKRLNRVAGGSGFLESKLCDDYYQHRRLHNGVVNSLLLMYY